MLVQSVRSGGRSVFLSTLFCGQACGTYLDHVLYLDHACTRPASMRRTQLVPHLQINANAHTIAVGVSPIIYRGKPNIKGWSGYKPAVQRWGGANASANGSPARHPTTVGTDESQSDPRRLGNCEYCNPKCLGHRFEKPGSIVRDTHGRGDNPLQSPPLWADRFTQPHWIQRVVGITPNRVPESEAVGSTTS